MYHNQEEKKQMGKEKKMQSQDGPKGKMGPERTIREGGEGKNK